MATQEDRSLSSGISIPQWIKTKTFDLEQNTFSPTELDDSFMLYYRNNSQNNTLKDKNNLIESSTSSSSVVTAGSATASVDSLNKNKPDFSKHTLYCQKFLQNSTDAATAQQVKYSSTTTTTTKSKPSGIDDGFKGEAAKCGTSVIRVAHQMVSGNRGGIPGFNLQSNKDCSSSNNVVVDDDINNKPPPGFNPSLRRGSKSLPASPLTSPKSSPKSLRRLNNKYFTGPFIVDNENHHGSWILSNLLSKRHTLSQSFGNIIEEEGDGMKSTSSIASSIDDLNENRKKKQVFVPQPSELREMNFWSPTSM